MSSNSPYLLLSYLFDNNSKNNNSAARLGEIIVGLSTIVSLTKLELAIFWHCAVCMPLKG